MKTLFLRTRLGRALPLIAALAVYEAAFSVGAQSPGMRSGPAGAESNPNKHRSGDRKDGQVVFRMETFGTEGFWTDALRLPAGMLAAKFTPMDALKAGFSVNIDAVDAVTKAAIAAELATDRSPANAPRLNDVATTLALINANAVIGVAAKDSNNDGRIDVTAGDKVGVTCAMCHAITDGSVFSMPRGGSIGKQVDGPTPHFLNVGAALATAANSRAFCPLLQLALSANDGKTIGRAPRGLTETSTEARRRRLLEQSRVLPDWDVR